MPDSPELVDASDIASYAETNPRRAQELLPHLMRRLLVGTPGVSNVSVRAGDSIGMTGYDGRADGGSTGTSYVPAGPSVWEFGTSGDPRKKAQDDYRSRTDNPLDVVPADTTFVAVTSRTWDEGDRTGWLTKRRAEGKWRQVVALDADDLHGWVETQPYVHVWLSEQMGRRPLEVTTLELWWQQWTSETRPELPADFLLAGRAEQAEQLREKMQAQPAVTGVHAASRDEAQAFIAASLTVPDASAPDDVPVGLPPVLVVATAQQWARLVALPAGLVGLIPGFSISNSEVAVAVRAGHHVLLPMGAEDSTDRATIVLPRLARDGARDALVAAGWTFEQADRDSAHARRSLQSLRRQLAVSPLFERPIWARPPAAAGLAPLVLVGSWRAVDRGGATATPDHDIVAEVAATPYNDVERALLGWADTDDPPFRRSGGTWRLAAPLDAWSLLHRVITRDDLDRWTASAVRVLTERDPAVDLAATERPYAQIRGAVRTFSGQLRRGVAQGAALLGWAGDATLSDGSRAGDRASKVVRTVLATANGDSSCGMWQSLADVLPLLAEAAPTPFLEGIEVGLTGDAPLLSAMFTDAGEQHPLAASSPHTALLWALETLAWSPEHLARVSDALARLDEMDPGGRLSNRPADSLRRIFLPWLPRTSASAERRFAALEGLAHRRPDVAFPLALGLLPRNHDFSTSTHRPTFRDWARDSELATPAEYAAAVPGVVDLVLQGLKEHPARWPDALERLTDLPPEELGRCLDALERLDAAGLETGVATALWKELVKLTARHRQFADAEWSLPSAQVDRLESIAERVEPTDSPERHARLFGWHPDLPGIDPFDHPAYNAALEEKRAEAVRDTVKLGGVPALLELARASELPWVVGKVAADVGEDIPIDAMASGLAADGAERQFTMAWIGRTAETRGSSWTEQVADVLGSSPDRTRSSFYLALPATPEVWQRVDADTADVQDQYWQSVGYSGVVHENTAEFADRLLTHRRPWSVIDLLALNCHSDDASAKPPTDLIERALRAALEPDTVELPRPGSVDYDVALLLDRLLEQEVDADTIFQLEFAYFPLLEHTRRPSAMFSRLAADPVFFVDVVCAVYGRDDHTEEERPPTHVWQQFWVLLRKWRRPPGTQDDGTIDAAVLHAWVRRARRMLAERGRVNAGDEQIGEVLSGSMTGTDGAWPSEAVRDLVEELASSRFETGLAIGKINSRGVTTRGVYSGGRQESDLAAQFRRWADLVGDRWVRTAALLRGIAEDCARDAAREDASADELADEG